MRKIRDFCQEFTTCLLTELMKKKPAHAEFKDLFNIIEDVLMCLEDRDEYESVASQSMIGIRHLFRGCITKV